MSGYVTQQTDKEMSNSPDFIQVAYTGKNESLLSQVVSLVFDLLTYIYFNTLTNIGIRLVHIISYLYIIFLFGNLDTILYNQLKDLYKIENN